MTTKEPVKFASNRFFLRLTVFAAILLAIFALVKVSMRYYPQFRGRQIRAEVLPDIFEQKKKDAVVLGSPNPGDWLYSQLELGQGYEEYIDSSPRRPDEEKSKIYIQPLGRFSSGSRKILTLVAEYLRIYFCIEVEIVPDISLTDTPSEYTRVNPNFPWTQYLSKYLLYEVLMPRKPADALAYVGFLEQGLWPGRDWNFVFGEATISDGVGVWSFAQFGDPDSSREAFRLALRRALKVASHETTHILGVKHCISYRCNMNGGMSLRELDSQPLALCPVCLAKLQWNTACDIDRRARLMDDFLRQHIPASVGNARE